MCLWQGETFITLEALGRGNADGGLSQAGPNLQWLAGKELISPLAPARGRPVQQVVICRRVEMGQLGEMSWLLFGWGGTGWDRLYKRLLGEGPI